MEQPQAPVIDQFSPTDTTTQPVNPMLQETQNDFSKPSESNSNDLPGLRPLNSDLIKKHQHHEKKPELSVKPPPVQFETEPPTFASPPVPPPAPPPAPQVPAAEQPPAPAVPPPGPEVSQPAPAVNTPATPAPAPVIPPAVPSQSPSSTQVDFSNQMVPSIEPDIPMVPMPPPQFFAPNLIPLTSIPLPVFLPGKCFFKVLVLPLFSFT